MYYCLQILNFTEIVVHEYSETYFGACEVCTAQVCVAEVCTVEGYSGEICVDEFCVAEVCADETCAAEVCVAEVCMAEVCAAEVCAAEVWINVLVFISPLIPRLHSSVQNLKMFGISHRGLLR